MRERIRSLRDRALAKLISSVLDTLAALVPPPERRPYVGRLDTQFQAEGAFTGLCQVREYTADGYPVGRCDFGTKDGLCPRHGDVSPYLELSCHWNECPHGARCTHARKLLWPRDFELPKYDGQAWAERLRREIHDRDTE